MNCKEGILKMSKQITGCDAGAPMYSANMHGAIEEHTEKAEAARMNECSTHFRPAQIYGIREGRGL